MNYSDAIAYLEQLKKYPTVSTHERVLRLLGELHCDWRSLPYIHVTGTNGKGSTCAFIASILQESDYKTGLFTSPHLFSYNERIKINGNDIPDSVLVGYVTQLAECINRIVAKQPEFEPCLFEVFFVMALLYFYEQSVDAVVIEVGIGGAADPTNIIPNSISIITNVGMDHMEFLGSSTADIATDKAGIIKPHSVCITAEPDQAVISVIQQQAKNQDTKLIQWNPADLTVIEQTLSGQIFSYEEYHHLTIPLLGNHQFTNAGLAILCAKELQHRGWHITEDTIRKGLANVHWPLRFEVLRHHPTVVADVGHNPHGLAVITPLIRQYFSKQKKIMIIGCSINKPYHIMAPLLAAEADVVIVTQAQYKAAPAKTIYELLQKSKLVEPEFLHCTTSVKEAVELAYRIAKPVDVILILGGLYLATEGSQAVL